MQALAPPLILFEATITGDPTSRSETAEGARREARAGNANSFSLRRRTLLPDQDWMTGQTCVKPIPAVPILSVGAASTDSEGGGDRAARAEPFAGYGVHMVSEAFSERETATGTGTSYH